MKQAFLFGLGAFVGVAMYWEALFIIRNRHFGWITAPLASFFLMLVLGWILYGLGSATFKRNVVPYAAFLLGVVAVLIQSAFSAHFIAHTDMDFHHEALVNSPWSDKITALGNLFLPFAICTFLAPLLGSKVSAHAAGRARASTQRRGR